MKNNLIGRTYNFALPLLLVPINTFASHNLIE